MAWGERQKKINMILKNDVKNSALAENKMQGVAHTLVKLSWR